MTYKETKEHGAHVIVNTTYYGCGDYIVNERAENEVTGNEFFTPEEAQKCIELLKGKGYISQDEFDKNPHENVYTYEIWDDADEYLDDKIEEENAGEYMEVELGSNEYIIRELARFLRDETIEECPINIVSREDIEGEDAELVRFTFGERDESCVAVVYEDGTVYTPCDWQTPVWDEEGWKISDTESWMDCYFRPCVMFNDMPRMLVS